jgi:hypothetical protein
VPRRLSLELERFDELLRKWEDTGHKPDGWEAGHVTIALEALFEGDIPTASSCLEMVETPHEFWPPESINSRPVLRLMTVREMREYFDELRAEAWVGHPIQSFEDH